MNNIYEGDKIVAIVITYFPDVNEVINNIKRYINHIDRLIIWENTPDQVRNEYKIFIPEYIDKIIYMSSVKNEGIAYPINKCIDWAKENSYSYIFTMDQDSYWENFEDFRKITSITKKFGNLCIMTPNINHRYDKNKYLLESESFITSGTLFPLNVVLDIGYFNEMLFVDGVDLDYSLRVVKSGIKIYVFPSAHLQQKFGYPVKSKYFNFTTSNYSSERTYNIVMNHILIFRKYGNMLLPTQKKMIFKGYIFSRLVKIILIEKNKVSKVFAIFCGFIKGFKTPLSDYFK